MRKIILLAAAMVFYFNASAFISQSSWRWRNDNGSETSATWEAAQNTPIIIASLDSNIRLRIQLNNTTGSDKNINSNLQYASSVDGPWRYVTRLEGNNAFVMAGKNDFLADQSPTTQQIAGSVNSFQPGRIFFKTDQLDNGLLNNGTTEFEWCFKPTENIDTGTVYYFRIPGLDYSNGYPALKTSSTLAVKQKTITNGSFENDLSTWTTSVAGTATAIFAITDSIHKYGVKELAVKVTNKGTGNEVLLTHTPFAINDGHVYLLRFWAKAKRDGALMRLSIQGNSTLPYSYKLYTGWEEFQFAFKANGTAASLSFLFQTATDYCLDDVELLDENNTAVDVPMNYMWQNKRSPTEYGWLTADGEISEPLPDGRTVWTFSDGWYGYNDTTANSMNTHQLIRNTLVVQDAPRPDGNLFTKIGGTVDAPLAIMRPPDPQGHDDFFWPRDMTVENDSLKVLLPDIRQVNEGDVLTNGNREAIGIFSLPDLTLQSIEWMPYIDTIMYGTLCRADDGFTYAYSSKKINSLEAHAIVARFPSGHLSVTTRWEFLTDAGWSFDYHNSKEIADVELYAVTRLGHNSYVSVFLNPLSDKMEAEFAQSPIGPWVGRTTVGQIEGQDDIIAYFGVLQEETANNGVYTFSYSNNGGIAQMLNDKTVYWPTYIKADLKSLSPFTSDSVLPVQLLNFAALAESKRVKLEWKTTSEINNDHFEIERSHDGKNNWIKIASVKANINTAQIQSYSAYDESPFTGNNFYRLKQLDKDGKMSQSEIRLAIMELLKAIVKVYPNPSDGDIWFKLDNFTGNSARVRLSAINGTVLFNQEIDVQPGGVYKLPLSARPSAGIYILRLEGNDLKENIKIIIK